MDPNKTTQVKFNQEATDSLMAGVYEVCEATATTLGARGRNVAIDTPWGVPAIIHDGVRVASSINPKEPFKKQGAKIIQEAARKQRDEVGDGTTAVLVLAQAILKECLKVTASGVNAMSLREGLESGAKKVVEALEKLSSPISGIEQMRQIATISAQNEELGTLIANTLEKVGKEGIVTVDGSKLSETMVEIQEGMQLDKGYANPYMITDIERRLAVLDDAYILVTDHPLASVAEISKFLETKVVPNTKKVLFISPEIGGDFENSLIVSKMQGTFLGLAVRAPGVALHQREILLDICALTGATFISKEGGFDDLEFSVLGRVQKVVAGKISTIITGGQGHRKDVLQRIQAIKTQMEDADISEFDHEQLKERLGKLTNGIAVIKVGGITEVEMTERKERAIDAVAATQAAVKHGIIVGGEIAYLNCLSVLDEKVLGEKILKEAMKEPFRRLVSNAGYDAGEKLAEYNAYLAKDTGFDVTDGKFKNMVKSGIIDPVSVPVCAIKTAVSVSTQLSSLGASVVNENEEKKVS